MKITHYIDIRLKSVTGVNSNVILSRIVEILHTEISAGYAIHFPNLAEGTKFGIGGRDESTEKARPPTLGDRLRVFGEEPLLNAIRISSPIERLSDYVQTGRPRTVGLPQQHVICKRIRPEKSAGELRRREMRRQRRADRQKAVDNGDIARREPLPALPYLLLNSSSNGGRFPVVIKTTIVDAPGDGQFNSYGLSDGTATVPLIG